MIYSVALDGPGGAGKSSIAKEIAKKRNIVYVDTGAMYRAIALYMLKNGVNIEDKHTVVDNLANIDIKLGYTDGVQKIYLNGEDVSADIRKNEVSMAASKVSALREVRAFLLDAQRDMAKTQSVVMDGRDIGTIVLPNARVKIYITADSRVRAERRYKELVEKGTDISFETVLKDIEDRDYRDIHRDVAPLRQARDAVLLDTSRLDFDRAVQAVEKIIDEKVKN
ncbi:MAG: (d)CMP kinase [Oscillospiraceae bacterium]|nr:(d)CMP kinase [Oscillospiraceae bacterium]